MVYKYDQILTKKNTTKFALIGVALVFAMTLMMSAFSSVSAATLVNGCSFDDSVAGTWTLEGDCTVTARIDIPADTTVDGDGHTMFASFDKTTNSNNAALGIIGADNVTVENLTIDGTGGNPWPQAIHGINTYKSLNVTVNDVVIMNMSASGIVVNGSTVSVSDVTTSGNGWHGINVDQGGGVTEPSVLNIDGLMYQTDLLQIYVDDATKIVTVNDTLSQYYVTHINFRGTHPNDELYMLEPIGEITTPTAGQYVSGVIDLEATYQDWDNGTDDDAVDWAVRAGTCAAGTSTVFGNVDGFSSPYTWDGSDFAASWDTTTVPDGDYCFIFNPRDDAGQNNVRETVTFAVDNPDVIAPLVAIDSPLEGAVLGGLVDIYGDVTDEELLSHYNISLYPMSTDLSDGNTHSGDRIYVGWCGGTTYLGASLVDALLCDDWDTTMLADGDYQVRLAARDAAGNRDQTNPYTGGTSSVHVINVALDNYVDNKDECKKGGWERGVFGQEFRNQGDCVSHFVSDKQHDDNPDAKAVISMGASKKAKK